jgi:hypothetical protein
MTDIRLDGDGDTLIVDNDIQLTSTLMENARQRTQIRLKLYAGEWVYDLSEGMPYFDRILIKGASKTTVDTIMKEAILSDPDIESITSFESEIVSEKYYLKFSAVAADGETITYVGQTTA